MHSIVMHGLRFHQHCESEQKHSLISDLTLLRCIQFLFMGKRHITIQDKLIRRLCKSTLIQPRYVNVPLTTFMHDSFSCVYKCVCVCSFIKYIHKFFTPSCDRISVLC